MTIRLATFDLEGTLVDLEALHHAGHLEAAREVGLDLTVDQAIERFPHFIGGPDDVIAREIWEACGESTPEEILAISRGFYKLALARADIRPRPGAVEYVQAAREHGCSIAIGSLTTDRDAMDILSRSRLLESFPLSRIVLRSHVHAVKPAPDVFLETARRARVDPQEQVVFEDSTNGVRAAVAAGSVAVGVPVFWQTAERLLDAGARSVFETWSKVEPIDVLESLR